MCAVRGRMGAFLDRYGYYLAVVLCVCVIVGMAAWTYATGAPAAERPGLPAAADGAQRLSDVTFDETPATPAPETLVLPRGALLRGYSDAPQRDGLLWRAHRAVDFAAGDVCALLRGTVLSVDTDAYGALAVRLRHAYGKESAYHGLTEAAVKVGDIVRAGQRIGAVNAPWGAERALPPHAHIVLYENGVPTAFAAQ